MTLTEKPFGNTVGKGENIGNQHFLLFPQYCLPFTKQISYLQSHLFCCLHMLSIWTSLNFCHLVKKLSQTKICLLAYNPFPKKPWFLRVCTNSLLKGLWEKEKLLVTSNFSFSHRVFYPFEELSAIFIKVKIVLRKQF